MHIAIIPDGNRRFSMILGKKTWFGHKKGLEIGRNLLEWIEKRDIYELSIYTLSLENLEKRSKIELKQVFKLLEEECNKICYNIMHPCHKYKIKVNFCGFLEKLPKNLQKLMKKAHEKTIYYKNHVLNIAIAYGGRQEMDRIIYIASRNNKKNTKFSIRKGLKIRTDPDLVIRTGGEIRISNFMLYQSAYSEFIFLKTKFPELTEKDLDNCLKTYRKRIRRYGS